MEKEKILLKKAYGDNKQLKVELFKVGKILLVQVSTKKKKYKPKKFYKFRNANRYYNKVISNTSHLLK